MKQCKIKEARAMLRNKKKKKRKRKWENIWCKELQFSM